ncbi:MAG: glycosyltransferase family 2 protein [Clostridiales bacterium]|nr:glycosyltransferase family 2 protein [Clostridiales bacterium]
MVLPCYNEENNIVSVYQEIVRSMEGSGYSYEIVFVDDGSSDSTGQRLRQLYEEAQQPVKVVRFSRNFGKEAAILAGMKETQGEYVSLLDADLQQHPRLVRDMVDFLEANPDYDCVAAYQEQRREGKFLSFCKKQFYGIMNKLTEVEFQSGASDFRTLRRQMVEAIVSLEEYYRFSKGIFSWVGFNTYYMPYTVQERAFGHSKWSFWKLMKYAFDGIMSYTTAPLRIATVAGTLVSIGSIVYMLVVIVQRLFFDQSVPGYATTVVLVLFLGGVQLFALGIIGEYLARTYVETKRRPIYIVREVMEPKPGQRKAQAEPPDRPASEKAEGTTESSERSQG